jgi:hypothetical protein
MLRKARRAAARPRFSVETSLLSGYAATQSRACLPPGLRPPPASIQVRLRPRRLKLDNEYCALCQARGMPYVSPVGVAGLTIGLLYARRHRGGCASAPRPPICESRWQLHYRSRQLCSWRYWHGQPGFKITASGDSPHQNTGQPPQSLRHTLLFHPQTSPPAE